MVATFVTKLIAKKRIISKRWHKFVDYSIQGNWTIRLYTCGTEGQNDSTAFNCCKWRLKENVNLCTQKVLGIIINTIH